MIPAVNEYYYFITKTGKEQVNKLGVFTWIFLSCTILEFLIIYKFGKDLFSQPWPQLVKWSWITVGVATALFLCIWKLQLRRKLKTT